MRMRDLENLILSCRDTQGNWFSVEISPHTSLVDDIETGLLNYLELMTMFLGYGRLRLDYEYTDARD